MNQIAVVRDFLKQTLAAKGDRQPFSDGESLFLSGRLGSMEGVELVVLLEDKFGIDFTQIGFDQSKIDSVEAIEWLIRTAKVQSPR
jgi:acyl carrier protein